MAYNNDLAFNKNVELNNTDNSSGGYDHPDASEGRFGDTLIRQVDGQDAHVNAWEANLIDRYGDDGETIVKNLGAGTINPSTGNKEYASFWAAAIPFAAVWGGLRQYAETDTVTFGGLWDYSLGKHGFGGWVGDWWNETDKREAATDVLDRGMNTIQTQANNYLGPDGFFADNMGIAMDKVSIQSNDALEKITDFTNQAIGKADVASSGTIKYMDTEQTDKVSRDYKLGVNEAVNQRRQDEFNLMIDLDKQKNDLLGDYVTTMEESYEGEFEDFDDMVNKYSTGYDSNPYDV